MAKRRYRISSKSQRKAERKTLRGQLANKLADRSLDKYEKANFYKNLRLVKVRRRALADALGAVASEIGSVTRQIERVHTRVPDVGRTRIDEALDASIWARKVADESASLLHTFARQPVLQHKKGK
ncbi:hypothetical protein [Actinokineospora sp. NBRC 105648]|uniref:hypothetical protein n=1 Tax=Actinokineospora sp. NBRC 105648 TaxID=3032206 RepID=UPI0024A0E620|nr:hypothetical protein [Actinokineospora sp. NBRC 105648]GLZ43721.1 hypothetical protein Acsp05_73450 [Actinokineospora sp. NBRC 105648]